MAVSIGTATLWLVGASSYAASPIIGGLTVGAVVGAAVITGASYGLTAATASHPSPTQQKQVINQPIGPRFRGYGELKLGGTRAFLNVRDSHLYQLIMLNAGEIDSFVGHWLGENPVAIDVDGVVTSPAIYTDKDYVTIKTALGTDDQAANAMLMAAFPGEWTSDHRLRGIAYSVVKLLSPPAKDFAKIYPSGLPLYNAVIHAAKVWDPRDEDQDADDPTTWTWTQNGVLILLDYLWHADGMRLSRAMLEAGIETWKEQADIADEAVALKAGGTEARYRLSGGYQLTAPPKQVLPFMLVPMDARLYLRGDGAIVVDVGRFVAPTITLTDAHIVDYSGMTRAREAADIRNKITANFVSSAYNYVEQEADPWLDQESIDLDGEQALSLDLTWVPSHAQARRRMKVEAYRQNPDWSGQIVTNAYGLRAIDQRFVQVQIDELGLDAVFEILSWKFDVLSGNCTFDISAMPEEAYEWDAATEEGAAPGADDAPADIAIEAPANLVVSIEVTSPTSVIVVEWDAPTQEGLTAEVAYRVHDAGVTDEDAVWFDMSVTNLIARSGVVEDDTYDVRVRFVSPSAEVSDYTYEREILVPEDFSPGTPTGTVEDIAL